MPFSEVLKKSRLHVKVLFELCCNITRFNNKNGKELPDYGEYFDITT